MRNVTSIKKIISYLIILLSFVLTFGQSAIAACESSSVCPFPNEPPCAIYQRADFVFTAHVQELLPNEPAYDEPFIPFDEVRVSRMKVIKVYKGILPKEINVKFSLSQWTYSPKKGETLFIYAYNSINGVPERNGVFVRPCELLTVPISHAGESIKNAKLNKSKKIITSISGLVDVSVNNQELTTVNITGNDFNQSQKLDNRGFFTFPINREGIFKVTITIPGEDTYYLLGRITRGYEVKKTNGKTVLTYEVKLKNKNCDYRITTGRI